VISGEFDFLDLTPSQGVFFLKGMYLKEEYLQELARCIHLAVEKEFGKICYLAVAVIKKDGGGELTALSKLSEIIGGSFTGEGTINVKAGDKSVDIKVTADTTISDVLTQLKDAGLNASFDAKWQRFSVSSKESGAANNFTLTAGDANGAAAIAAFGGEILLRCAS